MHFAVSTVSSYTRVLAITKL